MSSQTLPQQAQALFDKCSEAIDFVRGLPKKWDDQVTALKNQVDTWLETAEKDLKHLHLNEIDLTPDEFDGDTFYGVLIPLNNAHVTEVQISRLYALGKREDLGLAGLYVQFNLHGGAWGGNPETVCVTSIQQTYIRTMLALGRSVHGLYQIAYLRGGYKYNIKHTRSNESCKIIRGNEFYYKPNNQFDAQALPVHLDKINDVPESRQVSMSEQFTTRNAGMSTTGAI